jgi:NADH-dependent peroxiredoxin subunit F
MTLYDLVIIGGGPAGAAAAVYAGRKRLKTLLITKNWENQSIVSPDIQNWIGTISIPGAELSANLRRHVYAYAGDTMEIKEGESVSEVKEGDNNVFVVTTDKGLEVQTRAIIVATGSSRKQLDIPGAKEFEHKGLTYCATCDGPLFADQDVAVIGGGNAAFESAVQLAAYCKKVYLINRSAKFRADATNQEAAKRLPNIQIIINAALQEITGEKFVNGLVYKDTMEGQTITLPVTGIFVEIGAYPNTGFLKDLVEKDEYGRIITDPHTQMTTKPGIWAAGDCTNGLYHQNNIAAGDAIKALEDCYYYLHRS